MASLTAYFSYSGTTKTIAEQIAAETGSDLFEIRPAQPYTPADVNWQDKTSRNVVEYKDADARPAIADKTDISKYKIVYLGFPIWWYTNPRIINTFLDSYDFTGKKIVPFVTSGGTDVSGAVSDLRKAYPDYSIAEGARIASTADIGKLIRQ